MPSNPCRLEVLAVIGLLLPSVLSALDHSTLQRWLTPAAFRPGLHELRDAVYHFPANFAPEDETVHLPLRRWDIIFNGDFLNRGDEELMDYENVNYLIPGPFNHILVYLGKDARGMAWAAELNPASMADLGGITLVCIGSDYAIIRHTDRAELHDRSRLTRRWAMRLRPEHRERLAANEPAVLARLASDLVMGFPYQLEFHHSGKLTDPYVYSVDDGFAGGAGCTDYWTTLFEEYAGICIKGARMNAAEITDYFLNDPEGRLAYAPEEFSPFPYPITIRAIFEIGFVGVDDAPHVFSCDGTSETGVVMPSLLIQSDALEPIPGSYLPLRLPSIRIGPGK